MDAALPAKELETLNEVMDQFSSDTATLGDLRTRVAGMRHYASIRLLVPGDWTIEQGHDLVASLTDTIVKRLPHVQVDVHITPHNRSGDLDWVTT